MKENDFYSNLKGILESEEKWPLNYMFKFICPNEQSSIQEVHKSFKNDNATYQEKISKNGKYIALTFITKMQNSDSIIQRYRSLNKVDGLIML